MQQSERVARRPDGRGQCNFNAGPFSGTWPINEAVSYLSVRASALEHAARSAAFARISEHFGAQLLQMMAEFRKKTSPPFYPLFSSTHTETSTHTAGQLLFPSSAACPVHRASQVTAHTC